MELNQPLVSLILTSYNYEKYIGQTIASVVSQTYQNWELIISDDCSKDNSLNVIQSFKDDRITVITAETNEGAVYAYIKAYALCKGKYLCSLDSDDYIAPDRIEKQVTYLETHPEVDILGTFIIEIDADGKPTPGQYEALFNTTLDLNKPENWVLQNHLCHSSIMMKKYIADQVGESLGTSNKDIRYTPDYHFWVKALTSKFTFFVLPEKLTYYRSHGGNVTYEASKTAFLEFAYIFCTSYAKHLVTLGRTDLIAKHISLLMQDKFYVDESPTFRANLLKRLLFLQPCEPDIKQFIQGVHSDDSTDFLVVSGLLDDIEKVQDIRKWLRRWNSLVEAIQSRQFWKLRIKWLKVKQQLLQRLKTAMTVK